MISPVRQCYWSHIDSISPKLSLLICKLLLLVLVVTACCVIVAWHESLALGPFATKPVTPKISCRRPVVLEYLTIIPQRNCGWGFYLQKSNANSRDSHRRSTTVSLEPYPLFSLVLYQQMNKRGKFLKKLWCCVGGGNKAVLVLSTEFKIT